jgi:hypothetical protein
LLNQCLHQRNCPVRVHWADPTRTTQRLPEWLEELSSIGLKGKADEWLTRPKIREVLESKSDVRKLLTENAMVIKEIKKASKIHPRFTVEFAERLFMNHFEKEIQKYRLPWMYWVNVQLRYVMDFYTVARILKSNMKNVIFYAGNAHTTNVMDILSALDFKLIRTVNGNCA